MLIYHAAVAAPFDAWTPSTGDLTICGTCWAVLELTDDTWRLLTMREFEALEQEHRDELLEAAGNLGRIKGMRPSIRFAPELQ